MIYTCPICKRPHLFGKIVNELFKCVVKVTKEHKCLGRCGATLKVTLTPIRIPILFGLFHRNGKEYKSADVRVVIKNVNSGFPCPTCKQPHGPPLQCIDDCKRGYQSYTATHSCSMCKLKYNVTFIPTPKEYEYQRAELEII